LAKNRTFTHLTGTSPVRGFDGVQPGQRTWGNPATFVDRLSFEVHEPNGPALTQMYKTLQGLDAGIDVYLDSSIWDTNLDKKIWSELLNHARSVRVLPQVRVELEPWLQTHKTARAARALIGNNSTFSMSTLPNSETNEGAFTYYVDLLMMRRRAGDIMAHSLTESLGSAHRDRDRHGNPEIPWHKVPPARTQGRKQGAGRPVCHRRIPRLRDHCQRRTHRTAEHPAHTRS